MADIMLKSYELRALMNALHECQKEKSCVVRAGIGSDGLQKIKCELIYYFGLPATRELKPRIYKSCFLK